MDELDNLESYVRSLKRKRAEEREPVETGFYRLRNAAKTLRVVFDIHGRKCIIRPGHELPKVELPVRFAERLRRTSDIQVADFGNPAVANGPVATAESPPPAPSAVAAPKREVPPVKDVPIQEELTPGLLADLCESGRMHHFTAGKQAQKFLAHVPTRKADIVAALRDEQIRLDRAKAK